MSGLLTFVASAPMIQLRVVPRLFARTGGASGRGSVVSSTRRRAHATRVVGPTS
jgi:hypothetical protein